MWTLGIKLRTFQDGSQTLTTTLPCLYVCVCVCFCVCLFLCVRACVRLGLKAPGVTGGHANELADVKDTRANSQTHIIILYHKYKEHIGNNH